VRKSNVRKWYEKRGMSENVEKSVGTSGLSKERIKQANV
jgi:hypothetical protein